MMTIKYKIAYLQISILFNFTFLTAELETDQLPTTTNMLIDRSVDLKPDWTVLIFVQSRNNLHNFAAKNLTDMAAIGSNANLNILVQWYQFEQQGAWRYKIEKDKLILDSCSPISSDGNSANDLVDSARWAIEKYPAKNFFLILWNHGVGVLDPVWGKMNGLDINNRILADNPKIQIDGITKSADNLLAENFENLNEFYRGILFNEISRTYMTNREMVQALSRIKKDVLKNKKIDILGMDACLMAMLEVAYQSREFVKYMVASQEVELAHGWDYLALMHTLSIGKISPQDIAKNVVLTYEKYYKEKVGFYTQSAVDLDNICYVKENLDSIVLQIDKCKKQDPAGIVAVIKQARSNSLQLSTRSYIDLYSFYEQLDKNLKGYLMQKFSQFYTKGRPRKENNQNNFVPAQNSIIRTDVEALNTLLNTGKLLLQNAVIANAVGNNLALAKGLSIYFPVGGIDASYPKTDFAKDSCWLNFLQKIYR